MNVHPATPADAETGSTVLRRSIAELCHADHGGDPAFIAAWTANKTPESWRAWLAQPGASLLVAECNAEIIGVGMVDATGTILLNYVAPEARHKGVSTALLRAMEDISAERVARPAGRPGCTPSRCPRCEMLFANVRVPNLPK